MKDIPVVATDGNNIHSSVKTDSDGRFKLSVTIKEIDSSYYIEFGDETCIKKKMDFPGFGSGVIEMGTIVVVGPEAPQIRVDGRRIDGNILTINATVTSAGRLSIIDRGVCYSTNQSPTIEDNVISCGNELGQFQAKIDLKTLERNATYYFRVFARNEVGVVYDGNNITYSTDSGLPVINNQYTGVSKITATSATIYSQIESTGGFDITEVGVCWDENGSPSIEGNHSSINFSWSFSIPITGLKPSTTYYYYSYAVNANGIVYSMLKSFKTKDGTASVTTSQVKVSTNYIVCYGAVNSDDFEVTRRGFYVATNPSPSNNDIVLEAEPGDGEYMVSVPNLTEGTLYYVRAFAENCIGPALGDVKSARTLVTTSWHITDANGKGIPQASIYIQDVGTKSCNSNGDLSLVFVPGTYRIKVSADGYKTISYHDVIVSATNKTFTYTLESEE